MVVKPQDHLAEQVIEKDTYYISRRNPLSVIWQSVTDYIAPDKSNFTRNNQVGEARNVNVYDSTGIYACNELKGALQGLLLPQNARWFYMSITNKLLVRVPAVSFWLQRVTEIMEEVFASPHTRFYEQDDEMNAEVVPFGQGQLLVEEDKKHNTVLFRSIPLAQVYADTDDRGLVDTVHRHQLMSLRNIEQHFKKELEKNPTFRKILTEEIKNAKQSDEPNQTIIHAVYPRDTPYPNTIKIAKNLPYASVYVWKDQAITVKESGYHEFPYAIKRWSSRPGEIYGIGPGVFALPDVKMLNKMSELTIRAANKNVETSYQAPDGAFASRIDLRGDRINYYDIDSGMSPGNEVIRPIQAGGDVRLGLEMENQRRQMIAKHFYTDLLQEDKKVEMSATESQIRAEERMRLMSPILARFHTDYMGPLITRVFGILNRMGVFPEMPEELNGQNMKIEYVSPLHKAQKLTDTARMGRFLTDAQQIAAIKPEALDRIKPDAVIDKLARDYDQSDEILATDEEVGQIRQARQQQQELAFGIEQLQGAASASADLAKAVPAGGRQSRAA